MTSTSSPQNLGPDDAIGANPVPDSEGLGQPGLTQDRIGSVAAWNADGYREIPLCDRAMPDFVASLALPDERATGGA